jgi:hypothetical protein
MNIFSSLWAVLFYLTILPTGCSKADPDLLNGVGKKPVYIPLSELHHIGNEAPRSIQMTGTIFLQDTLLFILEQRKGIHVINIKDSLNTVKVTFLRIPAITDFTITDGRIYADSWKDLVVIDITNLYQIQETGRLTDVIQPPLYPPMYQGMFECVDESKGAVVDWIDAQLEDAACFSSI